MKKLKLLPLFLLLLPLQFFGQDKFSNTLFFDEKIGSPIASLRDISWLHGHWKGDAMGGTVEEIWAPPLGDSMMGSFKLVVKGEVKFYELETIAEENNSLILRVKHFGRDLKGWEEKDNTVDFKLVKVTKNRVCFDGYTIEKVNDNEINMYVVIDEKGEKKEVNCNYRRVK